MMLAKSLQSAAGNAAGDANYIEDVFSTYLYTGNGSTQTINNGIDLAGEGGLVWGKSRTAADDHKWYDTNRGVGKYLMSSATNAQITDATSLTAFNADGFSLGSSSANNFNGRVYVSWTFRKQPKFFDVVTYTGNGSAGRTVSHNLGAVPGCIIVKDLTSTNNWRVYHRSLGATKVLVLNATSAEATSSLYWNDTAPTSTEFTLGTHAGVNANGSTYVAYLFAHNAGGFGLSGEDNVISCGSYVGGGASPVAVDLGFEPQWILVKSTMTAYNWWIVDAMRGMVVGGDDAGLQPNTTSAEQQVNMFSPTATGFLTGTNANANKSGDTYIYIAIRRGPMKVPESGTEVFAPLLANTSAPTFRGSFPIDLIIDMQRLGGAHYAVDRLRGSGKLLGTTSTAAEATNANYKLDYQTSAFSFASDPTYSVGQVFRRAPGFFDEVCYTGTGVARTVAHNLAAVPELMIVKKRSSATLSDWYVYHSGMVDLTYPNPATQYIKLNLTNNWARGSSGAWNNTQPTASVFSLGDTSATNASGQTFVAYLFATLAGVSKVGSYTGTGTTLQVDCGFTAGARFVLIKRADSTGDWYVWDSARGIVAGDDPYLLLNSTAAEVTSTDYVDTYSAGFEISSTAPEAINASGGTFIFLAIA